MAVPRNAEEYLEYLSVAPPPGTGYSVPVPGSEQKDRTAVYRHWRIGSGPMLKTLDPTVTTAHEMFESAANRDPKAKCLGERAWNPVTKEFGKYVWQSYGEVAARRLNFGKGIVELHKQAGVTEDKHGVGLWCQNRPEWQITDLGCMSQSLYTVSIYDTLGPETTEYIINHAKLTCVATSIQHVPTLLKLKSRTPTLKFIICLDPLENGDKPGTSKADLLKNLAEQVGLKIYYLGDVEKLGAASSLPVRPPHPEDKVTINYTSGTTGNPKGVVLKHHNAVAAASIARVVSGGKPGEIMISYLPLAHIYERVSEGGALFGGVAIGYFRGDILGLVDDMKVLKPTGFISVPRLYNRFGAALRAATLDAPGLKGKIGRHVINSKLESMKLPGAKATNKHAFYDRLYTPKITNAFGLQRAKRMISGSAPLDPSLQQFLRACFGNDIQQGYGLTETYAIATCQHSADLSTGNCGGLAAATEACLQSVPDMDYLVTDKPNPRGELLLGGNTIFSEYYKNPEETTKTVIDGGRWFRTGDIAEIDSMGRIKIVDRVKNVLKLAQGEYISPERIENVYLANTGLLTQGYVHGDSTQAFLVAIFGVDPVTFSPFASGVLKREIDPTNLAAVQAAAQEPRVKKALVKELDRIGRAAKFNSYERVRNVHLELEPFTIENELLTPTLKLKRPQTAKKFRGHIDRMYEESLAEEKAGKAKL